MLGIILIGWGLAGEVQWKCFTTERQNGLLLCAITLIGLVVRTWGLDLTARFMQDETIFTDALMQFWHGGNPGLLNGGGLAPMTMVYSYWNAGTVELFGRNLIGLRMASALLGVLAIPTAYGLARVMFDRKLGLIAALFVATFPPHIHFSRISWGHMGDSLFGLMTLMFAGRGIKWNRRADWAFAGVSLGLTQYFYEVGRLLYPPLMVVWFILLMFAWKMKQYRQGIMISVIGAVIIAAPVYYAAAVRGESFTPRSDVSVIRGDYWNKLFQGGLDDDERRQILIRLTTPFLVYTHHPDSLAEYYGGFAGFVAPQLVPIFLLGVFWVTWRAIFVGCVKRTKSFSD